MVDFAHYDNSSILSLIAFKPYDKFRQHLPYGSIRNLVPDNSGDVLGTTAVPVGSTSDVDIADHLSPRSLPFIPTADNAIAIPKLGVFLVDLGHEASVSTISIVFGHTTADSVKEEKVSVRLIDHESTNYASKA
jgi:hypothetical protein